MDAEPKAFTIFQGCILIGAITLLYLMIMFPKEPTTESTMGERKRIKLIDEHKAILDERERGNVVVAPMACDKTNPFVKDWEKLCKNYPYKTADIMTEDLYKTLRNLNLIHEGNYTPSTEYINSYCRRYLDYKNNVKGRLGK
jgi:hypothetical protein